jgi:PAS domain S-box-containing protein
MDTITLLPFILITVSLLFVGLYSLIKGYYKLFTRNLTLPERRTQDSNLDFMTNTFHDVVARLKEEEKTLIQAKTLAEDKAQLAQNYHEHILQSVPSGVISADTSLTIKSFNPAAEKILDLYAENVIGQSYHEVFTSPLIEFLQTQTVINRAEFRYKTRQGKTLWLGLTASPLTDSKRQALGQVVVFTDLTQIKELQERVQLQDRLAQLGQISAGIAHELRNPMGVIAGYAKLLRKKIEPSHFGAVDAIINEIDLMNKIITELLNFARPTNLELVPVNLKSLIETAAQEAPVRDNIALIIDLPENCVIHGDETLLKQAFKNLITNSIEAIEEQGEIRIEEHRDEHSKTTIWVSDTGGGIDDETKEKIFAPFFTTKDKGIGLGLALVQKIIVSHGGAISVHSDGEHGTTFKISFSNF